MATVSTVQTSDGIAWHVEERGTGPRVVLVPSGEGDCYSYDKTAELLAPHFTVTTFDMPGMSRTAAPREAYVGVTAQLLADQIAVLMGRLSIQKATFYGCSSGALAVLALVARHPGLVQSAIVHEAPLHSQPEVLAQQALPDEQIVENCKQLFTSFAIENKEPWLALGPEFHRRLEKNYVTWTKGYVGIESSLTFGDDELKQRPLTWTIGGLMPAQAFFDNVVLACRLGADVKLLPCKHFPQVTIPEVFAKHIQESTVKYL